MAKKLTILLLCLSLWACKDEPIPTVSVELLPTELVGLAADTTFDSIPYSFERIVRDTIRPDSILVDTLTIDTLRIDTFFIDTIRLCGNLSFKGNHYWGPSLEEYGFCVDSYLWYIVSSKPPLPSDIYEYGIFSYELTIRNTDTLYVYAYAVNPFGEIRSQVGTVLGTDFDKR